MSTGLFVFLCNALSPFFRRGVAQVSTRLELQEVMHFLLVACGKRTEVIEARLLDIIQHGASDPSRGPQLSKLAIVPVLDQTRDHLGMVNLIDVRECPERARIRR